MDDNFAELLRLRQTVSYPRSAFCEQQKYFVMHSHPDGLCSSSDILR